MPKRWLLMAVLILAAPSAGAAGLVLVETVGDSSFDIGPPPGPDTAFYSMLFEEQDSGTEIPTGRYVVQYGLVSKLVDFLPTAYRWGPLSGGITLKGFFFPLEFVKETSLEWASYTYLGATDVPLGAADATVKVNCFSVDCPIITTRSVLFHDMPAAGAVGESGLETQAGGIGLQALAAASVVEPLQLVNSMREVATEFDDTRAETAYVDFVSDVVALSDGRHQYDYSVVNHLDVAVQFAWAAAGLAGELGPQTSTSRTVISGGPVREVAGVAEFSFIQAGTGELAEYAGPGRLLVPVPIPPAIWLFGAALFGLGVAARRR